MSNDKSSKLNDMGLFNKEKQNSRIINTILEEPMTALGRERRIPMPSEFNYIRVSTLELVAEEIYNKNVPGAVAELGVYQGDFARCIHDLFPDRHLYLFDTFEGFLEEDIAIERENLYSDGKQNFSDTAVDLVLSKMKNPENCIIKKGYFPDSLEGLEDKFALVSIDADLYKPIYEGLDYFYPRLSMGGYIFVHDYNNSGYKGAKKAVWDYCNVRNISYVPISDPWGSVIITK